MVPIFAPDGTLGDIPQEKLLQAVKAGAKPGVNITSPEGKPGVIPADRARDAVNAGAKIVPFAEQDVQHPGFWKSLTDDLKGMATNAYHAVTDYDPLSDPGVSDEAKWKIAQQMSAQAEAKIKGREAAGYGKVYSNVSAPAGEMLGVNVPGMEQSAREGDVAGVAGHAAAVPTALAATEAAGAGAGAVADVAGKVAPAVKPALKAGFSAVKEAATPENIATAAGGGIGAYIGHMLGEPVAGASIGGTLGKAFGRIFGKRMVADIGPLDATVENKPYAGETTPPPTARPPVYPGGSLPARPTPEQLNPALVSPARTVPGQVSPEVVRPAPQAPASPIPPRSGLMLPAADELAAARRAAAPTPPKVSSQMQRVINFRPSIERIIDDAVPPEGETYRDNLLAKAAVDQHLEQGNIAGAQQILEHLKEEPSAPEADETPVESPYKNYSPGQWKQFDERLGQIFEKLKKESPKQEAAPSTSPSDESLEPLLREYLRQVQARKAFLDQNAAH